MVLWNCIALWILLHWIMAVLSHSLSTSVLLCHGWQINFLAVVSCNYWWTEFDCFPSVLANYSALAMLQDNCVLAVIEINPALLLVPERCCLAMLETSQTLLMLQDDCSVVRVRLSFAPGGGIVPPSPMWYSHGTSQYSTSRNVNYISFFILKVHYHIHAETEQVCHHIDHIWAIDMVHSYFHTLLLVTFIFI
jgi:hypothetical protein